MVEVRVYAPLYCSVVLQRQVKDDGLPDGSDTGTMTLNVTAVNDAPVALDSQVSAFMLLITRIYLNGTDVDGEDPAQVRLHPQTS